MTYFPETLTPRTEAAYQWRASRSRHAGRWSVRYSSIPALVCALDVLLIIITAILAGTLYSFMQAADADHPRYAMTAIVIAAMFVPTLYNRGLYSPSALVNWKSQVRNIVWLWAITFLVFAGVAFALKVGGDFSRGTVFLFGSVGLMAILTHHTLWHVIIEPTLE